VRQGVPVGGIAAFAESVRRLRLVRGGLAFCAVAALAAAFLLARDAQAQPTLMRAGTSPIVVLDVSWSITTAGYRTVHDTLRDLIASSPTLGLVLFSDTAYEALPPGTPSTVMRPVLRYLEPIDASSDALPPNPWGGSLSGGTRIWTGLETALRSLHRNHIKHGSVVLISDLADTPTERGKLVSQIVTFVRQGIPLQVVALNPAPEDERVFRDILDKPTALVSLRPTRRQPSREEQLAQFPSGLVAAGGILLVVLGANEVALARLSWGRRGRP
jgi:hypothetical protein